MTLEDKIVRYEIYVDQNNFWDNFRTIRLSLESGDLVWIGFPEIRPTEWLKFGESYTRLYMTSDDYDDVYNLIQSESPVFFTALTFLGRTAAGVHTEFLLSAGETPGEGDEDPDSLAAMIRVAKKQQSAA